MPRTVYEKDNQFIYVDDCNRFIYERYIFVRFENLFSTADYQRYSSDVEIKGIIKHIYIGSYIEIVSELISAPLRWLIDNDFVVYVKPEKKKRKYTKKKKDGQEIEIT